MKNATIAYSFILLLLNLSASAQDSLKNRCGDKTKEDVYKTIEQHKSYRAKHPDDLKALHGLGMCYYKIHEYKTAIPYYDSIVALNPHFKSVFLNRGMCKFLLKDKAGACDDFKKCIENDTDYDGIMDGKKLSEYVRENCK